MLRLPWIIFCNLLISHTLEAYRALVIVPLPSKSHSILGDSLVQLIADAGNEITYLTSFPQKDLPARVRQISLFEENNEKSWSGNLNLTAIVDGTVNFDDIKGFITMISDVSAYTLKHTDVQRLMNDPKEKFDVIIAGWLFNEILTGLAPVFDCPFIWLSMSEHNWHILGTIDTMPSPTYTAHIGSLNQPPFNFLQRVQELVIQTLGLIMDYSHTTKLQQTMYENIIAPSIRKRGRAVPTYEEVRFNASLVLGNSHVSLGRSISVPQNYIQIGGYHILNTTKPLTGDLKNIMDNAVHGVIYFSLGTNLRSETFPDDLKKNLLKMFGELKQTVLWKFGDDIPNKPSNVHIMKWAPQNSILAHKNCILFITHGGFLSMLEAVHFGKPIIGIPVFGDQFSNVARAVDKGYAKKVDLSYKMADDIRDSIQDILSNPSYTARAKEISFIYHHRPTTPAAELLHWVEHVVRTRGALHLRSHALLVPWYQKIFLDLILIIVVTIFGLKLLIKRICSLMCRKTESKKKKN